ncbi:MAG: peroxiredoxin family protein [Desulfohalobiaceae bacterium]|nr:peroxiredoxin family protein [Desulfohalobiaceae bacterium]
MADFQKELEGFKKEGLRVLAGSVDPEDKGRELISGLKLEYPLAFGLDMDRILKQIGGFFESEKRFLQPSNFLLRPDGRLEVACYTSGPVGRFQAGDVLKLVRYYKEHRD